MRIFTSILVLATISIACALKKGLRPLFARSVIFTVMPGQTTCFLKRITRNIIIEVEYQILERGECGGEANGTISFELLAPSSTASGGGTAGSQSDGSPGGAGDARRSKGTWGAGNVTGAAMAARDWSAGAHLLHAAATGSYQFCFDNTLDGSHKKEILFNLSLRKKKDKKKIRKKKFLEKRKQAQLTLHKEEQKEDESRRRRKQAQLTLHKEKQKEDESRRRRKIRKEKKKAQEVEEITEVGHKNNKQADQINKKNNKEVCKILNLLNQNKKSLMKTLQNRYLRGLSKQLQGSTQTPLTATSLAVNLKEWHLWTPSSPEEPPHPPTSSDWLPYRWDMME